jgi:dihydropyrimidinase
MKNTKDKMDLLIKNGKVVKAGKMIVSDIAVDKGKIQTIGRNLHSPAKTVIEARGMLVLPGVIDAHVHFQTLAGGTVTAEDFSSGTRAAACGGVTTVIDFAIQQKGKTLAQAVRDRRAKADGTVAIDYALHAVPTDWNERTKNEIKRLVGNGISSFKMYMIYDGLKSDDAAIFSALEETSKRGAMVTVHAESEAVLNLLVERYHNKKDMKHFGAYCHVLSRPNFIEAEAIQRAVTWAEATGGRLYIVHLSTLEGVEIVRQAKERGVKVYAETCPQYLLFDDSIFKKRMGYLYATCPQLKKKSDVKALWQGLSDGTISVVATDNCTFTKTQKAHWKGDFTKIPYGLPGVETLLPLLYTYGVGKGLIPLSKMIELLAVNPARLMGLYPQKGVIAVGADADLVIFDPQKKVTISHKNLETKCDWSPYEGFKMQGYPAITIGRGKVVAINGKYVGEVGQGKYIKRGKSEEV